MRGKSRRFKWHLSGFTASLPWFYKRSNKSVPHFLYIHKPIKNIATQISKLPANFYISSFSTSLSFCILYWIFKFIYLHFHNFTFSIVNILNIFKEKERVKSNGAKQGILEASSLILAKVTFSNMLNLFYVYGFQQDMQINLFFKSTVENPSTAFSSIGKGYMRCQRETLEQNTRRWWKVFFFLFFFFFETLLRLIYVSFLTWKIKLTSE